MTRIKGLRKIGIQNNKTGELRIERLKNQNKRV